MVATKGTNIAVPCVEAFDAFRKIEVTHVTVDKDNNKVCGGVFSLPSCTHCENIYTGSIM